MHDVWLELRHASRVLVRTRGLTVVTVVVLGLGIGASTTLFSAINGVLRRPLPFRDPDRLVVLAEANPRQFIERAPVSVPNFVDWRDLTRTLDGLAAYRPWGFVLTGDGEPERVLGARVSANLFPLLGATALQGRTFTVDDDRPGSAPVVILGEDLWRRRFGANPAVIGRPLRLDGANYTVVGVMRAGFDLPAADLWVPLFFEPFAMAQRGTRALSVIARLKPGIDLPAAREDLHAVADALRQRHPDANGGWDATVTSLHQDITGHARTPLILLFAATGMLLLVACANLATVTLARSAVRRREIAVRAALGAGRSRIIRQLGAESMITASAGGVLAWLIAMTGTRFLSSLGPAYLPRGGEIRLDWAVLGFAMLLTAFTAIALATIAAFDVARVDLSESMKAGFAGPLRQRARARFRDVLVVAQVALALVLLVGAGLLVRSILRVQAVELGFSPDRVLSMTVSLSNSRYPDNAQRLAFFRDLTARVEALPGIRAAGLVSHLPLAGAALTSDFVIAGQPRTSSGAVSTADLRNVDAGYFRTMGVRVVKGRPFAANDAMNRRAVVLVDEAFADRFLSSSDPIGRRVQVGAAMGAGTAWREIVGVVSRVRSASLELEPRPTLYVPYYQNPWPTMALVIQTATDPASFAGVVRGEIQALDRDQPVYNVRSIDQVLARAVAARRFQAMLLGGFAATAVLLAVLGVYALFAYVVAQRTRELGIRVALGAQRRQVLAVVLRQALVLTAAGVLIGGASAIAGSRLLANLLFDISPLDRATFAGSAIVMIVAGLLASYVPARRAAAVDPIQALRGD